MTKFYDELTELYGEKGNFNWPGGYFEADGYLRVIPYVDNKRMLFSVCEFSEEF